MVSLRTPSDRAKKVKDRNRVTEYCGAPHELGPAARSRPTALKAPRARRVNCYHKALQNPPSESPISDGVIPLAESERRDERKGLKRRRRRGAVAPCSPRYDGGARLRAKG